MDDLMSLIHPVLDAVKGGNYALAGACLLILAVACLRKYGAPRVAFLHSDAGASLLALGGTFGLSLAAALATAPLSLGMLKLCAMMAVGSVGIYKLFKSLAVPVLGKLAAKFPWLGAPVKLLVWAFEKPDPIPVAEKAGADAVTANPGSGVEGIAGKPRDL